MGKCLVITTFLAFFLVVTSCYGKGKDNITNVKSFGAVGDGKTNDTKAIKDAFLSVYKTGGTIYFPSGKYLMNIIDIRPPKGITIEVVGEKDKSILIKDPSDEKSIALFFCEIPDVTLVFNSLKLEGSSTAHIYAWKQFEQSGNYDIANPVYGIFVYNLKKITVSDCTIENFYGDGISTYSTSEFIANNNSINNVNGTAIKGHRVINMFISDNRIMNTGFFADKILINGQETNRNSFSGKTRFGDGIEADCDTLIAKDNVIINPGRCGIVHDLAIDLGYKNSFATVSKNTVIINSNEINNGNPPAGMWFEQSANVEVTGNKIEIIKSKSKLVSGIRFFGITNSITCTNNIITANSYNMVLNNGIGIFEPEVAYLQISNNTIAGKFTSAVIVSYDNKKSHVDELNIKQNKFEGEKNTMQYAVQLYNGKQTTKPKNQDIKNNSFININAGPIYSN